MVTSFLSSKFSIALAGLLLCSSLVIGQNLVPNGSFEEYVDCPSGLPDMQAVGWSSSRGTCDYYNACAEPGSVGVPSNVQGFQNALNGQGYCGFASVDIPDDGYREHLTCSLLSPLEIDTTYHFSMYINSGFVLKQSPNKASNGQGALLTTALYSSIWDENPIDNPSPVSNFAHVINTEIIADSTNWVQVKGSFVADSAYTHLVIGSFLDEQTIDYINVTGEGPFETNGEAYYFVDEVRLSADSSFAWEVLSIPAIASVSQFRAYPNPTTSRLELSGMEGFRNYNVFSFEGRLVLSGILRDKHEIDLSSLPEGMYLIQLSSGTRNEAIRVVKTN